MSGGKVLTLKRAGLVYLAGFALTWTAVAATYPCNPPAPYLQKYCVSDAMVSGYFSGLMWPAYWAYRLGH